MTRTAVAWYLVSVDGPDRNPNGVDDFYQRGRRTCRLIVGNSCAVGMHPNLENLEFEISGRGYEPNKAGGCPNKARIR